MMNYKKFVNGEEIEMTAEEIAEIQNRRRVQEINESRRPLNDSEILQMLINSQINLLNVDDATAIRMKSRYPKWEAGVKMDAGTKWIYNDKLYKVRDGQSHTSQSDWTPDIVPALFLVINETHSGTLEDPIPYDQNMIIFDGLYYIERSYLYKCTRDSGVPLYNPLSNLIGHYVEKVIL